MRKETEKIVEIVKEAGKIAMKYFNELKEHHISTKDDGTLLTIADTETDKYIRTELEKAFPKHSVLSEESKNEKITNGVFIVDPIDGTKNFSNGDTNFGISIGFVINGIPEIGVVFSPATNTLYVGEKGEKAFCNDKEINVTNQNEISKTNIILHEGRRAETITRHGNMIKLLREKGANIEIEKTCASLDLCRIADGSYDVFIHRGLNAWDIAGGIVILEAAGGKVCHLDGSKKDIFKDSIIGSNPHLQEKIVELLKDL